MPQAKVRLDPSIDESAGDQGAFLRASFLTPFGEAARSLSLNWPQIVKEAGVPIDVLFHPDRRVPAELAIRAINTGALRSARADFGLLAAASFKPASTLLDVAFRAQSSIRGAIEMMIKVFALYNNVVVQEIEERRDVIIWKRRLSHPSTANNLYMTDYVIANSLAELRRILGPDWKPELTCFRRRRPADIAPYREMFGRVEFGHEFDGIVIDSRDANYPLQSGDPAVAASVDEYLSANAGRGGLNLISDIDDLVIKLLLEGNCTIESLARHQGVDRRTIHRRLQAHGTSFGALVDRARRDLVAAQLLYGDHSITEMAEIIGFSSTSTFSRWFRNQYGVTPKAFCRRNEYVTDIDRFHAIENHSTDIIVGINLSGLIVFSNTAVVSLGYQREDVVGKHVRHLVHPDDIVDVEGSIAAVVSGSELASVRNDWRLRTVNGAYHWFEGAPTLLFDSEGKPVEIVVILRNIDRFLQSGRTAPAALARDYDVGRAAAN